MTKTCPKCKKTYDLDKHPRAFQRSSCSADGLQFWCRACMNAANKAAHRRHKKTTKPAPQPPTYHCPTCAVEMTPAQNNARTCTTCGYTFWLDADGSPAFAHVPMNKNDVPVDLHMRMGLMQQWVKCRITHGVGRHNQTDYEGRGYMPRVGALDLPAGVRYNLEVR